MSLHQQGANKGAVTSFLISTPESGADSIAITYALLDPIMTVARPLAAFLTAFTAGIAVNHGEPHGTSASTAAPTAVAPELTPARPAKGPTSKAAWTAAGNKMVQELRFAFTDFWADMAPAFFTGVLLAGVISALVPARFITEYLGGGMTAMLIMLAAGIPLYICASASTPIAAALILKGVSPGAALVFLLAGPATNMAALAVVLRALGRRTTAIYLASIAGCALLFGMLVDALYEASNLSAQAVAGEAAEAVPPWLALACAIVLVALTLFSLWKKRIVGIRANRDAATASYPGIEILPHPETGNRRPKGPT